MGFWYTHPPFLNIKYNPTLTSIITINAIIIFFICELDCGGPGVGGGGVGGGGDGGPGVGGGDGGDGGDGNS